MTIPNKIKQALGFLYLRMGIKQLKEVLYDIPITKIPILPSFAGIKLYGTELDVDYYTTDWDNWTEILDKVYSILQDNPWTAEKFDCDNRAEFTSSLISMIYNLNTCARVYCEVSRASDGVAKYLHWCNVVIDKNKDLYIVDMDYGGKRQKITSNVVVMGVNKYTLKNFRIG